MAVYEPNPKAKGPRILVAHPQQQHSYRLAIALKRRGMLAAYATTIYDRPGSITSAVKHLLPRKYRSKAASRRCEELEDEDILQICEFSGLIYRLFLNVSFLRRWKSAVMAWTNDCFAKKLARWVLDNQVDAVICYDSASYLLFELLEQEAPQIVRIVDMSAANRLYLKAVYEQDFILKPDFAGKLKSEWPQVFDSQEEEKTKREIAVTQRFLCGSSFVSRSLEWSGVSPERCSVCHYGVDLAAFPYKERRAKGEGERLEFIFIGGTKELKGLAYLLDSFSKISSDRARLTIVGEITISADSMAKYGDSVVFMGEVPHDEISSCLMKADVMLFPSLGDGFSLSIMESLASGVPVVCSDNTGAADVIENGVNGFVIPTQDQAALDASINWFLMNRERIPEMAAAAFSSARVLTWETYYVQVADAVESMITEVQDRG